jgi:hypothetical protein
MYNHHRLCAVLTPAGQDVGALLIAEGLATLHLRQKNGEPFRAFRSRVSKQGICYDREPRNPV